MQAKAKQLAGWTMLLTLALLLIIIGLQGRFGVLLAIAFTPDNVEVKA